MAADHAMETARVLNAVNPHFIRLRSLRVPRNVPLRELLDSGEFILQTDDMLAREIRLFIETLDGITSTVASDHIMNLLENVSGKMPQDKARMLAAVDGYLDLSDTDRLIYRAGRRAGAYRSPVDLERDPVTYAKIKALIEEVSDQEGPQGVEKFIVEMADRYI